MLATVIQPVDAAPLDPLPAALDNPEGFFESKLIVEVNQHLLSLVGGDWHRPPLVAPHWADPELLAACRHWRSRLKSYALSDAWVDKDPRLCITFPAYLHLLLCRPPLAAVLRDPLTVAASLYARDGFSIEAGLSLWFLYNHHLAYSLQQDDLLLTYSSLLSLASGEARPYVIEAFGAFLAPFQLASSSTESLLTALSGVVRPSLNRAQHSLTDHRLESVDTSLLERCQSAYEAVAAAESDRFIVFQQAFDALPRCALQALQRHGLSAQSCSQGLVLENDALKRQLQSSSERLAACEGRVASMESSTSWRAMAPFRRIKDAALRWRA